jgi:Putative DNA-binding domain
MTPSCLDRLEREFQAYVLERDPRILQQVRTDVNADATARMDVYADGYVVRLIEALQTDFVGLHALAGDELFDRFGRAFIAAQPSNFRNLRWYGGGLAPYLSSTAPWSEQPELGEMARFEWAMATSFDAPDAPSLQREQLSALAADDWPRVCFTVHPAVQRVRLTTNVAAIWSAQAHGEPLPAVQTGATERTWLLTRRELQVRHRPMADDEAVVFEGLASGASFAQWCAQLGEAVDEEQAAQRAAQYLGQWLAEGALASFYLADT